MSRAFHILALLASTAATGAGQTPTRRDSAEVAVWRVVEREYPGATVSVVPWKSRWDKRLAPCGGFPTPYCGIKLDSGFRAAARDMEERNRDSLGVAEFLLSIARFQLKDPPAGPDPCLNRVRLAVSRVGFDSTLTYGIVSYNMSTCPYGVSATLLVRRRADSQWEVFDTIGKLHSHYSRKRSR